MSKARKASVNFLKRVKLTIELDRNASYAQTYHSTAIEGVSLTEHEVWELLEHGKPVPNKPFVHHLMVADHYQAIKFIVEGAERKESITPDFLKHLCGKVMHSTGGVVNTVLGAYNTAAGDFRLSSVRAGRRTFPDSRKVPVLVDQLCNRLNEGLSQAKTLSFAQQCELAFLAHYQLVTIHPFGDGNGRSSRLLMNYILGRFNLPMALVFVEDRAEYIQALEAARNGDTPEQFYEFMLKQYQKLLIHPESTQAKVKMGTGRDVLFIPDDVFDDDLNN